MKTISIGLLLGYSQEQSGSLHPQTVARCRCAVNAYKRRHIDSIFIGVGLTRNSCSMAEEMRSILLRCKVDRWHIVIDPRGFNTAGEIAVFKEHTEKVELSTRKSFIPSVVTSAYHISRAALIFNEVYRRPVTMLPAFGHESPLDYLLEPLKMIYWHRRKKIKVTPLPR